MIRTFNELLEAARTLDTKAAVVVIYPNNEETFGAIRDALEENLCTFILVGDECAIGQALPDWERDGRITLHKTSNPIDALHRAIELIRNHQGDILMKGGIDTGTMMREVLRDSAGIKTGRLLSDIFILEFPHRTDNKFIMITDGGMTLEPDLMNKVDLIHNAVEVAHALGNALPKVAVLSATEFVHPKLQSTLDAAALSKMNERGQIKGCIVDGPFALDNAISDEAASEKRLASPVAGHAEILLAANIESANSLAKSTTYFAGHRLAHVIVGGTVPILIPSRADKRDAKMLSIALGVLMAEYWKQEVE